MYVICNGELFVARLTAIRKGGYTTRLQDAQTFGTKEAAERQVGNKNERVMSLDDVMKAGGA